MIKPDSYSKLRHDCKYAMDEMKLLHLAFTKLKTKPSQEQIQEHQTLIDAFAHYLNHTKAGEKEKVSAKSATQGLELLHLKFKKLTTPPTGEDLIHHAQRIEEFKRYMTSTGAFERAEG